METNMNEEWITHLAELRRRLIVVVAAFVLSASAGLFFAPAILRILKTPPAGVSVVWNVFSFTDGLFVYLRCAFLFAAVFTLPVLLLEAWLFVRPGLTEAEAKGAALYIPASFLLFVGGMAFGYFVVFPMMVRFMSAMNQKIGAVETYGIDRYFAFLFNIVLPLGAAFEMPLILLFLTKLGLLTPARMRTVRKYAYVGLAVVGACISPPDFVSHLSVTVPLLALFEISVLVSARYAKKRWQVLPSNG